MSRDKQIEEMAHDICHLDRTCDLCMTSFECKAMIYAKRFYDKGYRKASEVAREIFEEIDKRGNPDYPTPIGSYTIIRNAVFAELKKKYTEGGE